MQAVPLDDSNIKPYQRAMEIVQAMAQSEDFAPGDKIPSERELSTRLGFSRMTVRKAIDNLVQMGILERRSTSGTHVVYPKVLRPLDPAKVLGIPQIIESSGGKPGGKLLHFARIPASESIAAQLQIEPGAPVILLKLLRTSDGSPFCIEKTFLPADLLPGLKPTDIIEGGSLYNLLGERYGIVPHRSKGELSAATIGDADAALLDLPAGAMALAYRVGVQDAEGVPIEYTVSINHPKRTIFTTNRRHVVNSTQ